MISGFGIENSSGELTRISSLSKLLLSNIVLSTNSPILHRLYYIYLRKKVCMCLVCAHLKLKSNKIRLVNLVELRGTGRQKTICVCNGGKRAQKLGSAESVKDFRKEFFSFSFSCFCANHQNFMSDLFNSRRDSIKIHCTLVFLSCDSFSPSWLSLFLSVFFCV